MLINTNDYNKSHELFVTSLKEWLQRISDEKIFVIVQNPQQRILISKLLDKNKIFNKNIVITTFYGLIYNTILNNKDFLMQNLSELNLVGLDASQYILKDIIKEIDFKDYKSQINILHQLFRRYSLMVQNDLNFEEMAQCSKIASESYIEEAQTAIKKYCQRTNELGSFDYLRQISIFKYLLKNCKCLSEIKYLTVFNCEEFSPVFYNFLKYIKPNLKDYLIFYDKFGATRIGYLCAEPDCENNLLDIFNSEILTIKKVSKYSQIAENLNNNYSTFLNNEYIYRTQMVDEVRKEVNKLLNNQVSANDIAIILPSVDDTLKLNLGEKNFYYLSGSEKLIDDFAIKNIIFLLDLLSDKINLQEHTFELKQFLTQFFNYKDDENLITFYKNSQEISKIAKNLSKINVLSQRIVFLYKQLIQKYKFLDKNCKNVNFLIKQIEDFEKIFSTKINDNLFQDEILNQLKISVISENSSDTEKIPNDKIIVTTEQKFIDNQFQKKHIFLLDVTSSQWSKNDIGPMYNAWVMRKNYDKQTFDIEDNIKFDQDKTARIFRKILLSTDNIYMYSCIYDTMGNENYSGLSRFLKQENPYSKTIVSNFIPRPDQKKVLDYSKNNLAIAAVPGAGKTTILLQLVKKLLKQGIKSENIFVLTYMDSAAKNFKERLKNILDMNSSLPNISTIHGLALRIIKENSNFSRLNLDENFEIIDDTKRSILFSQSFFTNKCKEEYFADFERGISIMKFTQNPDLSDVKDITLKQFVKVYKTYCNLLKENNLIDYDDMLVLALKLLKENQDILEYYQNLCQYIIEDEAQDSSALQQELIMLLSGKHKNLIRCGDVNQAITTTFTNADLEGFKNFIKNNNSLEMTSSQRCAKPIADFANKLNSTFKNSFYPIQINQVDKQTVNKNTAIEYLKFEEEKDEILDIANKIKNIQNQDKNANVAILVRNNYQVEKYENILNENGIKTYVKEGTLGQQKVFATIFAILNILNKYDNSEKNYKILCNYGFYSYEDKFDENNQFFWDIKYFQSLKFVNFSNLIIKIGYFYFKNDIDRANVEIISFLTKRICSDKPTFKQLLEKFEKLSKKPLAAFFKLFENASENKYDNFKVEIMTIHKSKGDEFDYVFIPEFSVENFPILPENFKIKSNDMFLENIKSLNNQYKKKTRDELQKFICDETLRLIYVAITRAKKYLYISFSNKIQKFNKIKTCEEVRSITDLLKL